LSVPRSNQGPKRVLGNCPRWKLPALEDLRAVETVRGLHTDPAVRAHVATSPTLARPVEIDPAAQAGYIEAEPADLGRRLLYCELR
jgi:hypothetical protein